ncbi:hypothetical protein Purlil1_14360 [Purpureocillium lilacinum]|uniref:Uncharacterized protein n=1 Tax=Purpureocillium lilacinum TaxID=33203 RepID=A0ABR0BBH6_PURLI|nr:hypothetical protein Purlil1_14360 [Purpureocillium lilacinum]
MTHDTDNSTTDELNEADARVDAHSCLDDGFDKQMEEFFDYILDAKAFEDMETYVNGGPGAVSTGFEESLSDK